MPASTPPPERLLLVGAPRSGLDSAAAQLRSQGVLCGHKNVYRLGTTAPPSWGDYIAEASWVAVPFLPVDATVELWVRHPLLSAASMVRSGVVDSESGVRAWAAERTPEIDDTSPTTVALRWWTAWNRRAAEHCDRILFLADRPVDFPHLNRGPSGPPVGLWDGHEVETAVMLYEELRRAA